MRCSAVGRLDAGPGGPIFVLEDEYADHSDPCRCVLIRSGERVRVVVNTAHADAWWHATWHAARPLVGPALVCRTDEPCDYDARADRPPRGRLTPLWMVLAGGDDGSAGAPSGPVESE